MEDLRGLSLTQQQGAMPVTPEQGYNLWGLGFFLDPLGFRKHPHGLSELTGLMERVGECGTAHHPLLPFVTLVGESDRFLSRGDRVLHVAESKVGLAEATVTGRYAPPIPRFKGGFGGVAQRLNGVGQPSKGTEGKPSHPDHPGLSA